MAILSVDIGTTGTRAVLFNETGDIITSSYQEYPQFYPKPGWAELDAETIWSAFSKTIHEVSGSHKKQIESLCISCMGNNIVPVRRDGTAIRNGILGFDTRTTEEIEIIRDTIGEQAYYQIRGHRPSTMCGLSKILWLKRNEPDTFNQTWKFITFGDFIRTRLGFPGVTDYSTAVASLPFDIQKMDLSETMMKAFGLNRKMFNTPLPSDTILGEITPNMSAELGLPNGVKLVNGGNDAMCGVLGAGITQATPNMLANITGTFELIAYVKQKPILTQKSYDGHVISCSGVLKDTFVVFNSLSTSGSVVRWFRDNLATEDKIKAEQQNINIYDYMFESLKFDGGKIIVTPYFAGSGDDEFAKGSFIGLNLGTSRQEMLQGVVEGVTHEMSAMVDRMEQLSDTPIQVIRALGGAIRSAKWLQLKADISGKKVEAVQVGEASALGAAILAGVATGVYSSYEQAIKATVIIKADYKPRPEIHRIYKRQHEIYKDMVSAMKTINKKLYYM